MFQTHSHRSRRIPRLARLAAALRLEVLEARTVPTFLTPVTYPLGVTAVEPVIADLDNDGDNDVAVAVTGATVGGNGSVHVFLGNGTGSLTALGTFTSGINPNGLRAGDVNGDGILDLVTGNFQGSSVSVLFGNGDGTFQGFNNYTAGSGSDRLDLGDFDGDSDLDIAVGNFYAGTVSILRNLGAGTFGPNTDIATGPTNAIPAGVEVEDCNGDGLADVTVSNEAVNTITALKSTGPGFTPAANYGTGNLPFGHALVDLDGDSDLDLVAGNFADDTVSALRNNSTCRFRVKTDSPSGDGPIYPVPGDFDGDGKKDVATINYNVGSVSVLLGNGNLTFQPPINTAVGAAAPLGNVAGDLNGDGFTDLVVTSSSTNLLYVLINDTTWPIPPVDDPRPEGTPIGLNQAPLTAPTPLTLQTPIPPPIGNEPPERPALNVSQRLDIKPEPNRIDVLSDAVERVPAVSNRVIQRVAKAVDDMFGDPLSI